MASMVAAAVDLREEMDDSGATVAAASPMTKRLAQPQQQQQQLRQAMDSKARFMIRTLPRDCNPTPVTAAQQQQAGMLSPRARKPSTADEDSNAAVDSNPFDDITEEKLQQLTGKQDLARVTSLQISVDSGKQSVEVLGELLPSLQQLRLTSSTLLSFRDLGTSLHSLQTLWVAHCGIRDLDGIGALTGLQQLFLQHNDVSDISPLTMHDELQCIDLEGNSVTDVGQIEQLAFCPQLTALNLAANPVCRIQHYRQIVANFVPQLVTLDTLEITDTERSKLADEAIDAAIHAFQLELQREERAKSEVGKRPESSHGRGRGLEDTAGSSTLSRTMSSSRLGAGSASGSSSNGADAGLYTSAADSMRDDYGSTLTHGTDIVFAGNVTSALRRHRSETESSDAHANAGVPGTAGFTAGGLSAGARYAQMERPQTPARESITATLDRAHVLDQHTHKSRDAILSELRAWQLETAGGSQVGVVAMDGGGGAFGPDSTAPTSVEPISPSSSPIKRRSHSGKSVVDPSKRPSTSAGVLRNGQGVREAFVAESASTASSRTRAAPQTPSLVKRHSSSSATASSAVPTSSARNVDILILDEHTAAASNVDDDQGPCSPRKTARGVFTTSALATDDWNLDDIAPKLDLQSTASFLNRSHATSADDDADQPGESSGSDNENMRDVARQLKQRKQASRRPPQATSRPKGFFNVAESLHAIDRWREQMDDDAGGPATQEPSRSAKQSVTAESEPLGTGTASATTCILGPACHASDEQVVAWMKEKHKIVAEIKTRDGFRRFFRGIEHERLTRILQHVFSDPEKLRRRLQLMQGYCHGETST